MDHITLLPKDCLVLILSRTSPKDVIRSSAVCKNLFFVSQDDAVWENFLPSDYHEIISQSCSPLPQFTSKKNLFLHLCHNPIFLINYTQIFALDKWGGKKCFTLGARALEIAWGKGDTPFHWDFESMPESRFAQVAVLYQVCWLEVKGKLHAKMLSPHTTYGAYFVFKVPPNNNYGLEIPVNTAVLEVDEDDEGPPRNMSHDMTVKCYYLDPTTSTARFEREKGALEKMPLDRGDGWMEVDMGRYRVGDIDGISERAVIEMTLWEVKDGNIKEGLIVHSIDLRPLD
ncbi:putative F-box protein PP2-B12 [Silene latifolia]|uniref:putative F-box protein PP2-B12 n=1 Tax=Silene latifolia TaxID=37657 RepID=UPI003D7774ED